MTFASGSYKGATIDGTATVKEGVTFTDASVEVNGTLNAKGGTFTGNVKFNGSSIANISGGSFNNEKKYGGVTFDYNVTGTITGGTFTAKSGNADIKAYNWQNQTESNFTAPPKSSSPAAHLR